MALHVCLLYEGGPTKNKSIRSFLEEQLRDPVVQSSLPFFFRSVWIWMLLFFRNKKPLLEGPCSSYAAAEAHVQEYQRLLGPDFRCYAIHHYGASNIEAVSKTIPNKAKIVLVPLLPHRCATLYSMLSNARSILRAKNCTLIEWRTYETEPAFIESICTQIRKQIISNKKQNYGLLFIEQRQPEQWNTSPEEYRNDLRKTVLAVMDALGSQQPFLIVHTQSTKMISMLKQWHAQNIHTVITVPTSWLFPSELLRVEQHKLANTLQKEGFSYLHTEAVLSPVLDTYFIEGLRTILEGNTI